MHDGAGVEDEATLHRDQVGHDLIDEEVAAGVVGTIGRTDDLDAACTRVDAELDLDREAHHVGPVRGGGQRHPLGAVGARLVHELLERARRGHPIGDLDRPDDR